MRTDEQVMRLGEEQTAIVVQKSVSARLTAGPDGGETRMLSMANAVMC
jgi:hypothetical protein